MMNNSGWTKALDRFRADHGSSVAETIIFVPLLFVLVLILVFLGRIVTTKQDVVSAARDGARAASVRGDAGSAEADANLAVDQTLDGAGAACKNKQVEVDLSAFEAGGQVTVVVNCDVSMEDIAGTWLPTTRTISSESTSVVDRYRGGDE